MLHTRIENIDDDILTGLLNETCFVCGISLIDYGTSTLFNFFELCYAYQELKKRAKQHPLQGLLNSKTSRVLGSQGEAFLRGYCQLRGIMFEGYETRKLYYLISALAPRKTPKIGKSALLTSHERTINLIKQRRFNGDL